MQNKSAKQIQAELEFMRRAYASRDARLESINRYLATPAHPLATAILWLTSTSLVISCIALIIHLSL
jgi:hypothetical protein